MFKTKVVEEIETHFVFNNFFPEIRAVHEIMWENVALGRPQMTIGCDCDTYGYKP
jgi:hypothetical protein